MNVSRMKMKVRGQRVVAEDGRAGKDMCMVRVQSSATGWRLELGARC